MRRPLSSLVTARWPWLAMSALVCVAALGVLLALGSREHDARDNQAKVVAFSAKLRAPDADVSSLGAILIRQEPEQVMRLLRTTAQGLLVDLDAIDEIDPRSAADIRQALSFAATQTDIVQAGAAFVRARQAANEVAGVQGARATRAERDSLLGSMAALAFATFLVAVLLSRERRMTVSAARRHAEEVQRLADHDGLTGLLNRRRFDADLQRLGEPGSETVEIVICDVNGLKAINDRLGHHAGDAVLVTATQDLLGALGRIGTVYRTGGDEFSVIGRPGQRLADLARSAFERDGTIIASVGAATWPTDSAHPREVLRLADNRMYDAKRAITSDLPGLDRV